MNFADEAVGNVTTLMKERGLWEDMIVVFSTGNYVETTEQAAILNSLTVHLVVCLDCMSCRQWRANVREIEQ